MIVAGARARSVAGVCGAIVVLLGIVVADRAAAVPAKPVSAAATVTRSFGYIGAEQTFAVPSNVSMVQIHAVGGSSAGEAGTASASVSVRAGSTLYVEVGGNANGISGGFNGGGGGGHDDGSGGGAGASDVRTVLCGSICATGGSEASLSSRLVVAGGGGGGVPGNAGSGGNDGRVNNCSSPFTVGPSGGGAGTLSAGGPEGNPGEAGGEAGQSGALGQGGAGGRDQSAPGGGGGGGYYGGGGGGSGAARNQFFCTYLSGGGGGGGGSSYAPGGTTGLATASPAVLISYSVVAPPGLGSSSGATGHRHAAVQLTPHSNGTIGVRVKVPGPGHVNVLVSAWNDNLASAAAVLQPAPHRFVFARARASTQHAATLRISVTPTHDGRHLVAHHRYPVTLRLWITYTPTTGHSRSTGYYGLHLP